jgi:nucleoid DNA-binding protein
MPVIKALVIYSPPVPGDNCRKDDRNAFCHATGFSAEGNPRGGAGHQKIRWAPGGVKRGRRESAENAGKRPGNAWQEFPKKISFSLTLPFGIITLEASHDEPAGQADQAVLQENLTVTKKEIVKQISDRLGLTQLKTKEIVQLTFDAIVDTLLADKRIELRNFGVFEVKLRKARKARNPRTGERVDVPPKSVVTFKPGKEMEDRVRLLAEKAAADARAKTPPSDNGAAPQPEPVGGTRTGGRSRKAHS